MQKKAYADVKVANRTIKCLRGSELGCSHRLRTKTTSSPTIRPGPSARLTLFNEEGGRELKRRARQVSKSQRSSLGQRSVDSWKFLPSPTRSRLGHKIWELEFSVEPLDNKNAESLSWGPLSYSMYEVARSSYPRC
jgi:hypothetical protein